MQIANHPHRDTPAAGEAVLALHSAAAQLLDPATFETLRNEWNHRTPSQTSDVTPSPASMQDTTDGSASTTDIPASAPATQTVQPPARSPAETLSPLWADIPKVLALHGGWGRDAMAHLLAIAHSRGLNADDLATAIAQYASPIASHESLHTAQPVVRTEQSVQRRDSILLQDMKRQKTIEGSLVS